MCLLADVITLTILLHLGGCACGEMLVTNSSYGFARSDVDLNVLQRESLSITDEGNIKLRLFQNFSFNVWVDAINLSNSNSEVAFKLYPPTECLKELNIRVDFGVGDASRNCRAYLLWSMGELVVQNTSAISVFRTDFPAKEDSFVGILRFTPTSDVLVSLRDGTRSTPLYVKAGDSRCFVEDDIIDKGNDTIFSLRLSVYVSASPRSPDDERSNLLELGASNCAVTMINVDAANNFLEAKWTLLSRTSQLCEVYIPWWINYFDNAVVWNLAMAVITLSATALWLWYAKSRTYVDPERFFNPTLDMRYFEQ